MLQLSMRRATNNASGLLQTRTVNVYSKSMSVYLRLLYTCSVIFPVTGANNFFWASLGDVMCAGYKKLIIALPDNSRYSYGLESYRCILAAAAPACHPLKVAPRPLMPAFLVKLLSSPAIKRPRALLPTPTEAENLSGQAYNRSWPAVTTRCRAIFCDASVSYPGSPGAQLCPRSTNN